MTLSLLAAMESFAPALPLGVALSAGADSTCLLAACAAKWPGQVVGLHVNHNIQMANAAFELQCMALCESLNVELRVAQVDARPLPGQSPEDAARSARYQALQALAKQSSGLGPLHGVALAQHADDQVETLLIALSRGAGLAGLSAMPECWMVEGVTFYRPLLRVPRAAIEAWLHQAGIAYLNDPMNGDLAYTRNRIRAYITPQFEAVFPFFRDTMARSAAHCAEAQLLLEDLARQELLSIVRTPGGLPRIVGLQSLNRPHQANVLRYWMKSQFAVIPSAAQLAELQKQIVACVHRGKQIRIRVGGGLVVRQGEVLNWYNPAFLQRNN